MTKKLKYTITVEIDVDEDFIGVHTDEMAEKLNIDLPKNIDVLADDIGDTLKSMIAFNGYNFEPAFYQSEDIIENIPQENISVSYKII